ncbi:MAG: CBS domain-containing protein [Myxococcales bacterium]|nr:CBS domain-containing protein [Myxococcales bacterium]
MMVRDFMSKVVLVAGPDDGALSTFKLMQDSAVRHLPVVDAAGALQGIVSDRDLRRPRWIDPRDPSAARYLLTDAIQVRDVMSLGLCTVRDDAPLKEAARKMLEHGYGALPVVDHRFALTGMLSQIDVLRALIVGAR